MNPKAIDERVRITKPRPVVAETPLSATAGRGFMSRRLMFCPSRSAFSLIELLIVIAIAAVVAALAAPRYGDAVNRYRVDAAARRITADLAYAQSRARAVSSSRSVQFELAGNAYQLSGETAMNQPTAPYRVHLSQDPYFVSIGTANFGGISTVTFNGYGMPSSAGFVQINSGAVVRTIRIDADTGVAVTQ